jgi:hypothetical protein
MLHRKFAVIKLWPELKTAEDECIARIKLAAADLGLECIQVDSFARLTAPPHTQLTAQDVDFVLSLHFETPKCYDIFSFVALWNPLQFYYEWGYRRCTSHLLTHDDFLSCSSPWADDHVLRSISRDPARDKPLFHLYHSLGKTLFPPTTGEGRVFYAGINWERVSGKKGRHGELLRLLDAGDFIRIFGPRKFQGVDVWAGYLNYAGALAFDGLSVVREINRAGIGLALSSDAHTQSELMSNRLFESIAAGAVTICDENPFARRFFGDSLLYIDCSLPPEETFHQVTAHIHWIRANPDKALRLAADAQEIFRREFTLSHCLDKIYAGLSRRKEQLDALSRPRAGAGAIDVLLLMPEFSPAVLEGHIESCLAQRGVTIRPILLMSRRDSALFGDRVRARLSQLEIPIRVECAPFFDCHPDGSVRLRRRIGQVLSASIEGLVESEFFSFVGPHERLFSNHFSSLLNALERDVSAAVAASNLIYKHHTEGRDQAVLQDTLRLEDSAPRAPTGYGRFLFRRAAVDGDVHAALRYLDTLAMHALVLPQEVVQSRRATVLLDVQNRFNLDFRLANPAEEREILLDYAPQLAAKRVYTDPIAAFEQLDAGAKTKMAVALAHSVPFPELVKKLGFGAYRWWLKKRHS